MLPSVTFSMIATAIVTSLLCDIGCAFVDDLEDNNNLKSAMHDGPLSNDDELPIMTSVAESETRTSSPWKSPWLYIDMLSITGSPAGLMPC